MVETDPTDINKNEAVEAAPIIIIKKKRGRPRKNPIIIILLLIINKIKSFNRLDRGIANTDGLRLISDRPNKNPVYSIKIISGVGPNSVYSIRIINTDDQQLTSGGLDRNPVYLIKIASGISPRRSITSKKIKYILETLTPSISGAQEITVRLLIR
jgi:hypothetical protein